MNTFLTALYRLSGATYDVVKHCSPDTKTRYSHIAYALLLTSGLAVFGGYEIASQFTDTIWIDLLVGLFWGLAVFSFDLFLINSMAGKVQRIMRIGVGLASVLITISALFITLNRATIETTVNRETSSRIATIQREYLAGKELRYAQVTEKKSAIARYHQANCVTEALNRYPGAIYEAKHRLCEVTNKEIASECSKLDLAEQPYLNNYLDAKKAILSERSNDYFAKLRLLPQILNRDFTTQFFALCGFIFFCALEIQSMTLKFNITKDDEYHTALNAYIAHQKILTIENLNEANRAAKEKAIIQKKKASSEEQQKQFIVAMDEVQDIATKEKAINSILKICINNGYLDSAKEIRKIFGQDESTSSDKAHVKDIFQLSQPMKEIVELIKDYSTNTTLCENIFNWIVKNITYDTEHSKQHYRTAMQTYDEKLGLCGELSVFYMGMLRAVNIDCNYCAVTKDINEKPVTHACVIIHNDDGTKTLSDVAYKTFKISHSEYRAISDEELMVKYESWNQG